MNSKKVTKWFQFLNDLKEDEVRHLAIAVDRYSGIINILEPSQKSTKIQFNGEINPHIFRANIAEGWIEQFVPIEHEYDEVTYEVHKGNLVVQRKYGEVELI
jgi:hypothetical protein